MAAVPAAAMFFHFHFVESPIVGNLIMWDIET